MEITLITASFNDEVHGTFNDKKTGCGINLTKPDNINRFRRGSKMTDLGELTCEKCKTRIAKEMIKADQKEMKVLLKEEKLRAKKGLGDEGIVPLGNTTARITGQQPVEPEPKPAPKVEPISEPPVLPEAAMDEELAKFAIKKPEPPKEEPKQEDDFLAQFAIQKPADEPAAEDKKEDDFLAQFAISAPTAEEEPTPEIEEEPPVIDDISEALAAIQQVPAADEKVEEKEAEQPEISDEDILSMFSIDQPKNDAPKNNSVEVLSEESEEETGRYDNDSDVIDVEEEHMTEVKKAPAAVEEPEPEENMGLSSDWDIIANQLFGDPLEEIIPAETESAVKNTEETAKETPAEEPIDEKKSEDIVPASEPVIEDISVPVLEDIAPVNEPVIEDISAPVLEDIAPANEPVIEDISAPVLEDIAPVNEPVIEDISAPVLEDIAPVNEPVIEDISAPVLEDIAPANEPVIEDISAPVLEDIAPANEPVIEDISAPVLEDIAPANESVIEDISAPVLEDIAPASEPVIEEKPILEDIVAEPVEKPAPPVLDDISAALNALNKPAAAPAKEEPKPAKPPVLNDIDAALNALNSPAPAPVPVMPTPAPVPVQPVIPAPAPVPVQPVMPAPAPVPVQPVMPTPAPVPVQPVMPTPAPVPVQPVMPAQATANTPQIISVPQITGYNESNQPIYTYVQMQLQGYDQNGQPILAPLPGQEIPVPTMPSFNKNTRLQDAIAAAKEVPTSYKDMTPGQRIAAAEAAKGAQVSANVSKIATNPHARSTSQAFISAISESKEYANQSLTETQGLQQRSAVLSSIEDVLSQLGDNSLKEKKQAESKMKSNIPAYQEFKLPTRSSSYSSSPTAPKTSPSKPSAPAANRPLSKAELKALKKQEKIDAKFQKEMAKRNK